MVPMVVLAILFVSCANADETVTAGSDAEFPDPPPTLPDIMFKDPEYFLLDGPFDSPQGTELELLAGVEEFRLYHLREQVVPRPITNGVLSVRQIQMTLIVPGPDYPTVEYRRECANDVFAQVHFFSPSDTSLGWEDWVDDPEHWTFVSPYYFGDVPRYGDTLRGFGATDANFFSEEFVRASDETVGSSSRIESGALIAANVETSDGDFVRMTISSFAVNPLDGLSEDLVEIADTLPASAPFDCVTNTWDTLRPHVTLISEQ